MPPTLLATSQEPRALAHVRSAGFRPDIEGLRAIAVLLVVAFHYGVPGVAGGFIGVDVFFVLSGYLITGLLASEAWKTGTISLSGFYARRVRRLLPASALMLAATMGVAYFAFSPLEQEEFTGTAVSTAVYLSNRHFALKASDYFGTEIASNPLLHTWSLAVEEQFYLVWPLLVLVAFRIGRSRTILYSCLALVSVLSFAGCLAVTRMHQPAAFFLPHYRAWEFGLGGLATFITSSNSLRIRRFGNVLGWAGLAGILLAGVTISGETPFPGTAALLPVLSTVAVLVAGALGAGGAERLLKAPILQYTGKLSYSLYLWHWPVLVVGTAWLGELGVEERVFLAAGSFGLAAIAHHFVENPIRFNRYLLPRPALSLVMAGAITAVGLGMAFTWRWSALRLPQYKTFASVRGDIPRLYAERCRAEIGVSTPIECAFGNKGTNASATVVLFGDSHAAQWFPALDRIAKEQNWRLVTFIKTGCPAVPVAVYNSPRRGEEPQCREWREAVVRRIVTMHPSAVITSNYSHYAQPKSAGTRIEPSEWGSATRQLVSRFDDAGIRVVLLRDTPRPGFDVPRCLARAAWRQSGGCDPVKRSDALDPDVFRAEQRSLQGRSNAFLLDLTDSICGAEACELQRQGMIIYRDENHLTARFAETLAEPLGRRLVPLVSALAVESANAGGSTLEGNASLELMLNWC